MTTISVETSSVVESSSVETSSVESSAIEAPAQIDANDRRKLVAAVRLFLKRDENGAIDYDASAEAYQTALCMYDVEVDSRSKEVGEIVSKFFETNKNAGVPSASLQAIVIAQLLSKTPGQDFTELESLVRNYLVDNSANSAKEGKLFFLTQGRRGASEQVMLWSRITPKHKKFIAEELAKKASRAAKKAERLAKKANSADDDDDTDEWVCEW